MRLLIDQRGTAYIMSLFLIPIIIALGALVVDIGYVLCTKVSAKHKLNYAIRSAAAQYDQEKIKDALIAIDPSMAESKFYEVLRENYLLDGGLNPLTGSIADGKVSVVYFNVINEGFPFTYFYGELEETITKPTAIAIVRLPIKHTMFAQFAGVSEESNIYVHVAASPELITIPVGELYE